MNRRLEEIYLKSPFFMRRLMGNAEGIRRNLYRKYGDYKALLLSISSQDPLRNGTSERELCKRLDGLLRLAHERVPFYGDKAYDITISHLEDLEKLPLLKKEVLRQRMTEFIAQGTGKGQLYQSSTSGSTGTPMHFFTDRESMRQSKAYCESFYASLGMTEKTRTVKISGVKVAAYDAKKPPYWVYIDVYRQLQCSSLHISSQTVEAYFDAFRRYRVEFGTGYPTAWLFLAQAAEQKGIHPPKLKAIVTDSEGITPEQQAYVEKIFGCPLYQTYGMSEVACFSIMCPEGHYHVFPGNIVVEITDDQGRRRKLGEEGNIVVTDLHSEHFPYIRYQTGDLGILGKGQCACGWKSPWLSQVTGRVEDYIITGDGRKIRRLGHIMKPAVGVAKSQLVQTGPDRLEIHVVPAKDFMPQSMETVLQQAKQYIGTEFSISWKTVAELEKTKKGKVKYIVRKWDAGETDV